jgi:hypothetical protein
MLDLDLDLGTLLGVDPVVLPSCECGVDSLELVLNFRLIDDRDMESFRYRSRFRSRRDAEVG